MLACPDLLSQIQIGVKNFELTVPDSFNEVQFWSQQNAHLEEGIRFTAVH